MIELDRRQYDVIWFDLDDTLIDFRLNSHRAMESLFRETVLKDYFKEVEDWWNAYYPVNNRLWTEYGNGEISADFLRSERFYRPLVNSGMSESEAREIAPSLDNDYLYRLSKEKSLIPGALNLLQRLREAGFSIGVLSNGFNPVQQRKIESAGLTSFIDYTVLSEDIGVTKPDTRLFEHAMDISGIVSPKRHVMIGDNPSTDIRGAVDAGWKAILLDRYGLLYVNHPAEKIANFEEILVKKRIFSPKKVQK
ncbi:MAG: YjjG family noncanonical pyrimidine nucleotidase [Paramuribaculum sp.]|nr:YjjG family noncanonical pyrimidine nucleotidase [Paramuribaculum sp.]